ncbi:MAG: TRAP transporter small permease subunit [Candidatus Competibacteraceae bacterium]|nr:TRAP transporter small permease subunit [Candidatus Competibacteraceae bacterium]
MTDKPLPPDKEIHLNLDKFVHHTELPQTRISAGVDRVINVIGEVIAWVWMILMLVIVLNVTLRYAFGQGLIVFEEIQWHIYSVGFLIALSHCLVHDDHVRVDVLHDRMGLKAQTWIELIGLLVFLLPFAWLVAYYAIPFVVNSFEMAEVSDAPGGLPYRWIIKAVLPIGFALLWIAALSRLLRCTAMLFGFPRPIGNQAGPAR